jgi:hypothetical protein
MQDAHGCSLSEPTSGQTQPVSYEVLLPLTFALSRQGQCMVPALSSNVDAPIGAAAAVQDNGVPGEAEERILQHNAL